MSDLTEVAQPSAGGCGQDSYAKADDDCQEYADSAVPWVCQLRAEVRRRLRAQRSTQKALAAHVGITPVYLGAILRGRTIGSAKTLDALAEAMGLRVVLIENGEPVALPDDMRGSNMRGPNRPPASTSSLRQAGARRSAQAAVAVGARVERALEILGADAPEHLVMAGRLRVANRQASLEELGQLASPPLTKDAIAGRIRRLLVMAEHRAAG